MAGARRRARLAWWVVVAALALPAAVLTALRLGDPTSRFAVQLVAFAPYALILYAGLGLVGALAWLRGRRDRAVSLVSVVAAVGMVGHGWWLAPLFVGGAPEAATGAPRTVLMTANVLRGGGDALTVVQTVEGSAVDVLVVSEITPTFLARLDRAGLRDTLAYRVGEPDIEVSGTMVFARSPIEVVDRLDTVFDGLVVRTAGLTLLAAHPAPPTRTNWRDEQDVVAGDLNATLDHASVRELVGAGWRDSVELTNGGLAPTWPAHGEHPLLPRAAVQIDHVLVRDTYAVLRSERVDVAGTDHLAVLAVLAPAATATG